MLQPKKNFPKGIKFQMYHRQVDRNKNLRKSTTLSGTSHLRIKGGHEIQTPKRQNDGQKHYRVCSI